MNDLLADSDTYVVMNKDSIKKIINNLKILLKRWRSEKLISNHTFRSLMYSEGVLPRAYGLPKIHKVNCPLRIIVSFINCPLHAVASFLHKCLYDNLPKPRRHVSNSFELVNKLKDLCIDDHYDLLSLDVVNLFTNVLLNLVIRGIGRRWYFLNSKITVSYNEFLIALRLIFYSNFFKFNNKIYKQIFGTPMGSSLFPILADIVMQDLEENAISCLSLRLPFYSQYVDDVVLGTPSSLISEILNLFNSFHKRL